jgi:hypothetical protein
MASSVYSPVSQGSCNNSSATYDIGPALIELVDPCDPNGECLTIDCGDQLEALELEVTQTYSERRSQCSSEPIEYRKSGMAATLTISLGEGQFDPRLLELIYQTAVEEDPTDPNFVVIRAKDDAGLILPHRQVKVIPYQGDTVDENTSQVIIMPWACVMSESFSITYGVDEQRSLSLSWHADPHPDSGERLIIRQPASLYS